MANDCPYNIQDFGPSDLMTSEVINERRMKVSLGNELAHSAFGELQAVQPVPVIQITAQYGLRSEVETVAIGGTATAVDSKFRVSTGAGAGNISSIASTKLATYRAGQGLLARFTALYTTGVPNSSQVAGLLTSESLIGFGYDGDEFGIVLARGGELEQWEIQITSGAAGSESATVTIDSNNYSVPLTAGTPQKNAYEIAISLNAQVPGYGFSSVGDIVEVLGQLPDLGGGSFAFSSATATAVLTNIQNGLIPPETWVPQAQWNIQPDFKIDPTKGNVYQVQMQYLGFGGITFFIENPKTARFEPVHIIQYANAHTIPSVSNPIFRVGWGVRNKGNTTDIVTEGASAAMFIEGETVVDTSTIGASQTQIGVGPTATAILSLQNRRTYSGTANRAEIIGRSLVLSTDTTKTAKFELVLNPIIQTGEFLEFESLGDDNLGEVARNSATVLGGRVIAAYDVKAANPFSVDIGNITSRLQPGDIFCVVARVSSGPASEMSAAMTWQDDL